MLSAAVEGAEWAWADLYDEYAGRVAGYVRARGAAEPDDIVGDVFLQVARSIGEFEGDEAAFRSWVFVIAHHRVVDERRRSGRRPAKLVGDPAPVDAAATEGEISPDTVYRLLNELTDDQRNVLLLRIVAGMSLPEVADAIGKRLGTVTHLQRRALGSLHRSLVDGEVA